MEGKPMLDASYYERSCHEIAPELPGKIIAFKNNGEIKRLRISEVEIYCGEEDTACHAHRGRTKRTEPLYHKGGTIYIYLCYGIHWLLNIVTGKENEPQAILIRACENAEGPGKLTKALGIDGSLNGADICDNGSLWLEDDGYRPRLKKEKRVGIGYASKKDQNRLWRFVAN